MMPDDELTVMWRQAKDHREQVKILAELNGVSTAVMAETRTMTTTMRMMNPRIVSNPP